MKKINRRVINSFAERAAVLAESRLKNSGRAPFFELRAGKWRGVFRALSGCLSGPPQFYGVQFGWYHGKMLSSQSVTEVFYFFVGTKSLF